ncbi:membrane protein [Paenibacillus terrigena]|uniref:membrane protein n=1 Tax=Paenibacillus terrigena TaxID=369333 RepID=UPI0003721668|nr:membrane protein [Paenibacillus terrigena]
MDVHLSALHWIYVACIVLIIGFMVRKRDTTLLCIAGIFVLGLVATGSLTASVSGIFSSFIYALKELLGTILIISVIVALSRVLSRTGINEMMVSPFTKLIRTPTLAYWTIGIVMMVISWFFWPSPAVALIGAVLLPVAIRAGLPALGVAVSMNLFGHGIALSSDYIIQAAPKLTADAAGIPVGDVISASVPLVLVMGIVTTVAAFWFLRRDMKNGSLTFTTGLTSGTTTTSVSSDGAVPPSETESRSLMPRKMRIVFSILVPLFFLTDVAAMIYFKLQGGDATALIGGTALLLLLLICLFAHGSRGLEQSTTDMVDGFLFGFRVFGPVIPIAAFFYLGDSAFIEVFGKTLPAGSHGIVNDLGLALAHTVPVNTAVSAATLTTVGAITGLDGSGFSGISLAGSIANLFGTAIQSGVATLTALGQIAAIWVGGGTIIPWALIPAAAICGINPFELARRNLKPVIIGLVVTTIVAMFLI